MHSFLTGFRPFFAVGWRCRPQGPKIGGGADPTAQSRPRAYAGNASYLEDNHVIMRQFSYIASHCLVYPTTATKNINVKLHWVKTALASDYTNTNTIHEISE